MSASWLPEPIAVDWNQYQAAVDTAYAIFCEDFRRDSPPTFQARPVNQKRHPEYDGKSATFWHLVTEGRDEATRVPVRARLERIAWPRAMIENSSDDSRVLCWPSKHRTETRWSLALPDFSYVVVLADRGEYLLIWTAFTVDREHTRTKLNDQHGLWLSAQKS